MDAWNIQPAQLAIVRQEKLNPRLRCGSEMDGVRGGDVVFGSNAGKELSRLHVEGQDFDL